MEQTSLKGPPDSHGTKGRSRRVGGRENQMLTRSRAGGHLSPKWPTRAQIEPLQQGPPGPRPSGPEGGGVGSMSLRPSFFGPSRHAAHPPLRVAAQEPRIQDRDAHNLPSQAAEPNRPTCGSVDASKTRSVHRRPRPSATRGAPLAQRTTNNFRIWEVQQIPPQNKQPE